MSYSCERFFLGFNGVNMTSYMILKWLTDWHTQWPWPAISRVASATKNYLLLRRTCWVAGRVRTTLLHHLAPSSTASSRLGERTPWSSGTKTSTFKRKKLTSYPELLFPLPSLYSMRITGVTTWPGSKDTRSLRSAIRFLLIKDGLIPENFFTLL